MRIRASSEPAEVPRFHRRGGLEGVVRAVVLFALALGVAGAWAQGGGENPARPSVAISTHEPNLATDAPPLIDLSRATWRFHPGDDPAWAAPGFDDSQWVPMAGNRSWDAQGFKGLAGFAWYRIHVKVPPGKALEFGPGHVFDNFDVFVNGQKLATWGRPEMGAMPKYGESAWSLLVPIPAEDVPATGELVIALRVYHWPAWAAFHAGGFGGVPKLLGVPAAVQHQADQEKSSDLVRWLPALVVALIQLLAGILSVLLYQRYRRSSEYLWFGLEELLGGLGVYLLFTTRHWIAVPTGLRDGGSELLFSTATVMAVIFIFRFIGRPIDRWARWVLLAQIPIVGLDVTINVTYVLSAAFDSAMMGLDTALLNATILWVIFSNWRDSRAARRLALPMILIACVNVYSFEKQFLYTAAITPGYATFLINSPFSLSWNESAVALFLAAMAYVLTERFAETQRERSRLAGEFEAARTVQQVLIPDNLPSVAGLTIESAYLPAQEVGGDFFQVLPLKNGACFVVVGDVSGKGLQAAMTVSLIVGTLRTLAEYVTAPAQILEGMNRRLCGRGEGFSTCLALHISPNGEVTAANAGHPNPYLDGHEVTTAANLPLGISPDAAYEETRLRLNAGARLTLVTDGVVEATNAVTRELFGFTRTEMVSTHSAQSIAEEAQFFGAGAAQADDITVLTVVRAENI